MAGNESLLELRPGAQRNPIGPGGLGVAVEIVAGGGGGGGDASAANQVLALTALDSIYDALQLVGTEATSADILAAVNSLAGGSTLGDLATALAPLATEATQADVLAALQAQGVDIASVQANVALLVPDLDAVRVAVESTDAKTPVLGQALAAGSVPVVLTAAQIATLTPLASVAVTGPLTDAQLRATRVPVDGSGVTQPISGTVGADLRVANAAVTAANPAHVLAGSINWTAVGAIASAQNAAIKASAGRLHSLRVEHASTGTQYLQLHDAASTGAIAAGTIRGLGYELVGSGDELVIEFDPPLSFMTGISWALSTTKNTYTAAAGKAAFVEARWE